MAGNITNFIETWSTITSDFNILHMVKGCHVEFDAEPVQHYVPKHLIKYTHREKGIIEVEITKLLQKGVIWKAISCTGQFISSVFIRPKKGWLLSNDPKSEAIECVYYKPPFSNGEETLQSALTLVTPGSYMVVLHLKDT